MLEDEQTLWHCMHVLLPCVGETNLFSFDALCVLHLAWILPGLGNERCLTKVDVPPHGMWTYEVRSQRNGNIAITPIFFSRSSSNFNIDQPTCFPVCQCNLGMLTNIEPISWTLLSFFLPFGNRYRARCSPQRKSSASKFDSCRNLA